MLDLATCTALDRDHVWHPYSSPTPPRALPVVRDARGTRLVLETESGTHEVVDAMASWWCAAHGYRHPVLDDAVAAHAGRFAHVMFGGLTHEPALRLVRALVDLTPEPLQRVFLADSGSVAMEVALKIVRQVALARAHGRPERARTLLASLRGGYHGDTWGAMSVCDPDDGMHAMYSGQLTRTLFLPRPPAPTAPPADLDAWREETSDLLHEHRDHLAGIVCEPVLQGAGGMWSYSPDALRHLRACADELEVPLVADEIATGFGRTGTLWGCERAGVVPDVMAVGKAMTGGYVTQAAVLCTNEVARLLGGDGGGALMHGPTFMANPLASAISAASVGIIAEGAWRHQVPRIEATLSAALEPLRAHPLVRDIRVLGATAAVALARDVDLPLSTDTAIAHGVWLRPFRNLVYAMPPYVTDDADLHQIAAAMVAVVTAHEERA